MTVRSCLVEPRLTFQVRYCQFTLMWRMDCLRLEIPFSGTTEADTWPDFRYLKWKLQRICSPDKLYEYLIISMIFYVKANIYKPDLFSYYSSNLVCMLRGVSKINYHLVFRLPLACSQDFVSLYSMFLPSNLQYVRNYLSQTFLPPVCSPLGPVCINKIRQPESEKTQRQKWWRIENGASEFWKRRRKLFLNGDFVS